MSFYFDDRTAYPALDHGYATAPHRHISWWHIALLMISIVMASVGVFAQLVLGNLQEVRASASSPLSSNPVPNAPATLAFKPSQNETPTKESQQLQASIETWITAHPDAEWSVEVRQLDGGLEAGYKEEQPYVIASLFKLFLLQPFANKVPSDTWASGDKACIDLMLRLSDNACADAIGGRIGWTYADKYLQSLGYGNTHLSVGMATGTASDTTKVLENLYNKNSFDTLTRQLALDSLAPPKKVEGIRQACSGCTVYNKVGYIDSYKHDAAIIEKSGHAYSVVILSNGGSWSEISSLTAAIQAYF